MIDEDAVYEEALRRVMAREITKLTTENQKIKAEIKEMDQIEEESNGRRTE